MDSRVGCWRVLSIVSEFLLLDVFCLAFCWLLGAFLLIVLRASSVSIVLCLVGFSPVSCLLRFLLAFCFGSGGGPLLIGFLVSFGLAHLGGFFVCFFCLS